MLGGDIEFGSDTGHHSLFNGLLLHLVRHVLGKFSFEDHASRRCNFTQGLFALLSLLTSNKSAISAAFSTVRDVRGTFVSARFGSGLPGESGVIFVGLSGNRDAYLSLGRFLSILLGLIVLIRAPVLCSLFEDSLLLLGSTSKYVFNRVTVRAITKIIVSLLLPLWNGLFAPEVVFILFFAASSRAAFGSHEVVFILEYD